MAKRDLKLLEDAIKKTEESGLEQKLGLQLQMAKKILEQLKVEILCSRQEYTVFCMSIKSCQINSKKTTSISNAMRIVIICVWKQYSLLNIQNYNALLMD